MRKVLHYKTNYLNRSETFINRLVRNHQAWSAAALCYRKRFFSDDFTVFEPPKRGFQAFLNTVSFHLNLTLPFYRYIISDIQPDLIHAHFGFDGYKLVKISRALQIPLVVSFYGSDVSRLPTEPGWKKRYRKLAESGSFFIAASDFMKSQLIGLGFPESGLRIVRFGLDLEEYPVLEGERNPNNLMMVGRLVEKKGFEYGLRAVAESRKHGHHWNVNIFGDGPLMDSLQKLTNNLGLASSVRFHGFLPADAVLKAHRDHSLLLAPSVTASDGDMEGLPNTILEAMALGTPVIATKHAAIPEAITHTKSGFLVRERDTGGLADILNKIASGQFNLVDIQKNARTVVEQHYNIQKMAEEVESVYGRVLSAKTS